MKCLECEKELSGKWQKKFCSRSCSVKSNKNKILENIKKINTHICEKCGVIFEGYIRNGRKIHCDGCKRRTKKINVNEIDSLFECSSRTISKILNRMNLECSICGWNKSTCDLHHIVSRKDGGSDHHRNLSCVCPNCHRMIHNGLLEIKMNLEEQIGDSWKKFYATSNC